MSGVEPLQTMRLSDYLRACLEATDCAQADIEMLLGQELHWPNGAELRKVELSIAHALRMVREAQDLVEEP